MRLSVAGLAVVAFLAGCEFGEEQSKELTTPTTTDAPSADAYLHYNVRWIDNGAIDLMSPEATFLRAFVESETRAGYATGDPMQAIEAGGFPGFAHAFNNARSPDTVGGVGKGGPQLIGTDFNEVVDVRREGDQYKIVYCNYRSLVSYRNREGQYPGLGTTPLASANQISFGPDPGLAPDLQRSPKSNQKGPARVAIDNVFGTWVATPGSETMDRTSVEQWYSRCSKWAPGTPDDWPRDDRPRPTPPPTLPPSPGWPAD
ncbi:hypothetical protein hbim_02342 [Mycolicibacterium mageritense]|uniref:Uncharacterized protein n=1 Tax=Mycolicibacterium mageritense TaxID=53462 RepID=A0AAI8XN42_MYCME|nr:hypothetical protein hbim_02342 [Mycolicibacterium mageritense]